MKPHKLVLITFFAILGCDKTDVIAPSDPWDLSGRILFQPYGPGPYQSQGVWAIDLNSTLLHLTIAYPNGYGFRVSPNNEKIVAVGPSSSSDGWGLFTVELDRIFVNKLLGATRFIAREPAWSPDGTKIVFIGEFNKGGVPYPHAICTVNQDGTGFTALTDTTQNQSPPGWPSWSPDGSEIVYIRNLQPGSPSPAFLSFIAPDGSGQIDREDAYAPFPPKWSPNGRFVAYARFISDPGDSNGVRVFVFDTETNIGKQVAPSAKLSPWGLNWTANNKLACPANSYNGAPLNGGLSIVLCSPITLQVETTLISSGFENASIIGSPDGEHVAILGVRSQEEGYALYVARSDGSNFRFLKTILTYSDFSYQHHNGVWIE